MKPVYSLFLLPLLILTSFKEVAAQQYVTDTIFYNKNWQICEAPIASYYRVGEFVVDSFWYYRGPVKDYSITDSLIMEGEYNNEGYKQGPFKFYYNNGQVYATGYFNHDKPDGLWHWWYPDGAKRAMIRFNGDEQDFKFELYKNESGDSLLKNGEGSFDWETNPFSVRADYYVHGGFHDGRRSGKWEFLRSQKGVSNALDFTEVYNKEGKLKRVNQSGGSASVYAGQLTQKFSFIPERLKAMEDMDYDPLFRRGGDSMAAFALLSYLIDKQSLKLKVKQSTFDSAFLEMVKTLDSYRGKFNYRHQDIDGKIKFRLGEKGILEDISITGKIDSASRKFMFFLMEKFTNIDMPGTAEIAIESYHTIYFYSIEIKDYFPASLRDSVDRDFFITATPKEQMIALLNAQKKTIRKYIRRLLF